MPFVSQKQKSYLFANHPKIAKRWAAHTPKGKQLPEHVAKEAALEPLQTIGSGAASILGRFTPKQWSSKLLELNSRASGGDDKALELLSMIGVASIVLGTGLGMAAGSKLGGPGARMLGAGFGGLLGAAPALASSKAEAPVSTPDKPVQAAPLNLEPWKKSGLL